NVTSTANLTRVNYTGTTTGAAFVFQAGNVFSGADATFPAALAGWSTLATAPSGVYGLARETAGHGVIGVHENNGTAVKGESTTGLGGGFRGAHGIVAEATAGVGLQALGALAGAFAGDAGITVRASSGAAVLAQGGILGGGFIGADGVRATAGTAGTGIEATGAIGGKFTGSRAALSMATTGAPVLTRTDAHNVGEIDADTNKDLWMCVEAGTPGKWRKITGLTAAGSFHAITPTRVYDSRQPQPSPGPLSNGQNRTITVKDARTVNGGAITITNAIPTGATAVAANITITATTGTGFLAINPGGNTTVTASTINWFGPDQTIANGVTLTLNTNRELTAICDGGGGSTHFIIDITGYYL
ncbi:MAG: hypothetical protein WCC60_21695, partial [Ilumatobacteraceae bacterium]